MRNLIRVAAWHCITKPILKLHSRVGDLPTLNFSQLQTIKDLYLQCPIVPFNKKELEQNKNLAFRILEVIYR